MTQQDPPGEIRFEFSYRTDLDRSELRITSRYETAGPFLIPDARHKAQQINGKLPGWLDPIRAAVGRSSVALTNEEAAAVLDNFGYVMELTVLAMFAGNPDERTRFERAVSRIGEAGLAEATADPATWPLINVVKDDADPIGWAIPFELFDVAAPRASGSQTRPQFERFLGLRAPIIRTRDIGKRSLRRDGADRIATLLMQADDPHLQGLETQRRFFGDRAGDFSVLAWPGTTEVFTPLPTSLLANLWAEPREIIHLACHFGLPSPNAAARFDFGNQRSVTFDLFKVALRNRLVVGQERPFLFLNACNTATPTDLFEGIIPELAALGFRDIIGGRCLLPDRVAAAFATALYEALFSSEQPSLAHAVVLARRRLTEGATRNPAGLLYVHYGSTWLRAEPRRTPLPAPAPPPAPRARFGALRRWLGG